MAGTTWHVCPICKRRFKGSSRMKYCSNACKIKALGLTKGEWSHESNDAVKRYKELLAAAWINPAPWEGKSPDSMIYGNMIFL